MKKFLVLVLCLFSQISHADYMGELYGNSQTEREIKWVWRHLADFVLSCNSSKNDCKDPAIKKIITEMNAYLPKNNAAEMPGWDSLLVFVSEKSRPDLFLSTSGETHRVAVTELKRHSKVFINTDRMDLTYETWTALLIHEVVHHLGYEDDLQRLPDQVGNEILRHVKSQMQVATLDQFNLKNSRIVTFNSLTPGRGSATLLSAKERSGDMGWSPQNMLPICDLQNEEFISQYIIAPAWRVNRIITNKNQVAIRGAGFMKAVCKNKATAVPRTVYLPMNLIIYLKYNQQIDFENWKQMTPVQTFEKDEMSFSPYNDFEVFSGLQTFYVASNTHENTILKSGDKWKTNLVVQSTDGFDPKNCEIYFSGSEYSYITRDGLPDVVSFETCTVVSLGNNQWQVSGDFTFPINARTDKYYVAAIRLLNSDQYRWAVPTYPNFIQVTNSALTPKPIIRQIQINSLTPAKKFREFSTVNSFLAIPNQSFSVSFIFEGSQKPSDIWFDLTLWLTQQNNFIPAQGTGASTSFPQLITNESITPVANGTEVKFEMVMPQTISGYPLAAIKFKRFYMKTSDFSWIEIENLDLHDTMVINTQFGL
jgi:hypothetical protein